MKKYKDSDKTYKVTLFINNQTPVLLGYWIAKSANIAKHYAATQMTLDGCPLKYTDPNLNAELCPKNTDYEQ